MDDAVQKELMSLSNLDKVQPFPGMKVMESSSRLPNLGNKVRLPATR